MKVLYVGDPHVTVPNLDESDRLMDFLVDTILVQKPDMVVLLGDLMHNFAIVRTEVLDFWKEWLDTLSEAQKLVVLVGNHDLANSGNDKYKSNSLSVFQLMRKKNLSIVEHAQVHGPIGFVPYMHDQEQFLEIANGLKAHGAKILVIHQDINGSQYENGFYAPNGIDPEKLDYPLVIGGHIHKRQRFGKVILPGTARWMISSDANEPKGLWLVNHDDETGLITSEEFIDTSSVCQPIISLTFLEGEATPVIPENARVTLELIGSSSWIAQQKVLFKNKVMFKTKITDKAKVLNRQAGNSFGDYLLNVYIPKTAHGEALLKMAKEIGIV